MDVAFREPAQPLLGVPCACLLPLPTVQTVCRKGPREPPAWTRFSPPAGELVQRPHA